MINISNAQKIDGWMFDDELTWLATQAKSHSVILEVGSFLGRSTRALGDNTNGLVYAVDPWNRTWYKESGIGLMIDNQDAYLKFLSNLSDLIPQRVNPYRMKFADFWTINIKPDMIFIDGSHTYNDVIHDIALAKKLMPKGLICGHDYTDEFKDVKRGVQEMLNDVNVIHTIWYKEL